MKPTQQNLTEQTCDCGRPGQWWGDKRGLRIFACAECAAADPNLPDEYKPQTLLPKRHRASFADVVGALIVLGMFCWPLYMLVVFIAANWSRWFGGGR